MKPAEIARDNALNWVARKLPEKGERWIDKAVVAFKANRLALKENPFHSPVTAEWIRLSLVSRGLELPHHHNAWGAFIMALIRAGYIVPTGQYVNMKTKESHARRTAIYQIR